MNYLKRAWLSVTRRKGKSLLLFSLIFIIANVIAGALSIQQATKTVEEKIKSTMGASATIRADYEKLNKLYEEGNEDFQLENLPIGVIEQVGSSSYVKYYDYNVVASAGSENLKQHIPQFFIDQENSGGYGSDPTAKYYAFNLKGVNYPEIIDIKEKKINLVEGRVLTQEEVAKGASVGLISKTVADLNAVKVGDTITVSSYFIDYKNVQESGVDATKLTDYPIEVVGIFEVPQDTRPNKDSESNKFNQDDWSAAFNEQLSNNTIYMPNKTPIDINQEHVARYIEDGGENINTEAYYTPIYVLNKPEDVNKFKEENKALIPQYYLIEASSDQYDTIAAPVQSMSKLAGYVLIVAIIAAILIITLVVLLFLRDRKHELGIYLSFGEMKTKVFAQILVEVFLIAFLAISLAVFTGNLIAQGLSGTLIQQQLESQTGGGFIGYISDLSTTNVSTDDVVNAYQVSLTPLYILIMYGVGLGTVLLATLAPLGYILRLNPKKIMM